MPKVISSHRCILEKYPRPSRDASAFIFKGVIDNIKLHAECGKIVDQEVMGLIIGSVCTDMIGDYIWATETVTSSLDADRVSVRFKEDSLEDMFKLLSDLPERRIVGWYHSHLGEGSRLSQDDILMQERLYGNDPGFALIVDPVNSTIDIFSVKDGKVQKTHAAILEPDD